MIDLKGIEYLMFAGLGAIAGLAIGVPILTLLALIFPTLWAWIFTPVALGAVAGLIFAAFIE